MQNTQHKRNAAQSTNPQHQRQYQRHQRQPQHQPQYRQGHQPQARLQHRQQIQIEGPQQKHKQKFLTPASVIRRYEYFTRHNIPQCQWATFDFDPVRHPQVLFELLVFTPHPDAAVDSSSSIQCQDVDGEMDMDEEEDEPMLTAVISQRDGRIAVTHLSGGCTATTDMEGCGARWTVGKDAVMRDGDDVFKG